jgi:methyl-accepting chemotaxis protein
LFVNNTASHGISNVDNLERSISMTTLQQLKTLTNQELERICQQRSSMESVHSNLDLLIKRYNIEQSYVSQISNWYGANPWWAKALLFLLTAAIGASIGMFCHLPLILALVACAIHIFFAFFFANHHKITQKQMKVLCEDIIEIEKSLTVTINHFNELTESLQKIFASLYTMNNQMIDDIQLLEDNISELSKKLCEYNNIIQQLSSAKEYLVNTTQIISAGLQSAGNNYHECHQIVVKKSADMSALNNRALTTNSYLTEDSKALQQMTKTYHLATLQINKTAKKMEEMYLDVQARINIASNSGMQASVDAQPAILNDTTLLEVSAEEESNHIMEDAKQARNDSTHLRNKVSLLLAEKLKGHSSMLTHCLW